MKVTVELRKLDDGSIWVRAVEARVIDEETGEFEEVLRADNVVSNTEYAVNIINAMLAV